MNILFANLGQFAECEVANCCNFILHMYGERKGGREGGREKRRGPPPRPSGSFPRPRPAPPAQARPRPALVPPSRATPGRGRLPTAQGRSSGQGARSAPRRPVRRPPGRGRRLAVEPRRALLTIARRRPSENLEFLEFLPCP